MAWIESHQDLREHPKTISLCEHLGAERPPVVGHLHLLWWWCINYAPNGDISKYSSMQISRAAEWKGDPEKFMLAMISSGFIERIEKTTRIHDWEHYCGALMERRLRRMEAKRPPMASERPPTQPNHTQPYPTNHKKEILVIPEDLKTNESEIKDWLEYKKQKGQTYKPKGIEALWRSFRSIPPEKRRESVDHSMANNWSGLFEKRNGQFDKPDKEKEFQDELKRRKELNARAKAAMDIR